MLLMDEQTPKVQTILSLPSQVSEPAPPQAQSASLTQTPLCGESGTSALLGGSSSTPTPSPLLPQQPPAHSVLWTPPRRSPFHPNHIFQTPSPPRGIPELPGLTPLSSDGEEEQQMSFTQPSRNGMRPDFSAIKTPRPPGAWSFTPRQPREELVEGSMAFTSDADHEDGLAAPVASLSRVRSMPTRTPAPPGAWTVTSTSKRPLQKVRFDTRHSHTEHSLAQQDTESSNLVEAIPYQSSQSNNASVPTEVPRTQNEETTLQLRPTSNSARKSPSIRVVDAFGREQVPEDSSLDSLSRVRSTRRKTGVRILDAMGRDIDGSSEVSSRKPDEIDPHNPLNNTEALTRVRQGLSDLARGLDVMDRRLSVCSLQAVQVDNAYFRSDHGSQVDVRLLELNDTSRAARETRQRLYSAEAKVQAKFEPLRSSMENGFPVRTSLRIVQLFRTVLMFSSSSVGRWS